MPETASTNANAPAASPSAKQPRAQGAAANGKATTREEYLAFLEAGRKTKGEAWYMQRHAEMATRDEQKQARRAELKVERDAARKLAQQEWSLKIDAWSRSGGFESTMHALQLNDGVMAGRRMRFKIGDVPLEVDLKRQACTRWDGAKFTCSKGAAKKGLASALGLAMAVFELRGSSKPFIEARDFLINLSGIAMGAFQPSADAVQKIKELEAAAAEEAKKRAEAEKREDPIAGPALEEVPRRIADPSDIAELTAVMAKERAFPLEFAQRLVAQGIIWFGTYKWRDDEGVVHDTGRAIACSDVTGFATGTRVGISSRELREFYSGSAKGKNLGAIFKGSVVIGKWTENTKRITLVEGVYDGAALLHMRERRGRPLGEDECILCMTGSRTPERLIELCGSRGVSVISALDNDPAGRKMAAAIDELCKKFGVAHEIRLPTGGETEFRFANNDWGRAAYLEVVQKLKAVGCPFQFLAEEKNQLRLVARTTDECCLIQAELAKQEQSARPPAAQGVQETEEQRDARKMLHLSYFRKDWNELLQHPYTTRAHLACGLPIADGTQNATLAERLTAAHGDSVDVWTARIEAEQVYPVTENGRTVAVWPAVDQRDGSIAAFLRDGIDDNVPIEACGATWSAGVWLGIPEAHSEFTVGDSLRQALARGASAKTCGVIQLGSIPPADLMMIAGHKGATITADFANDAAGERKLAELTTLAREQGVPVTQMPARRPSIDVTI